MSMDGHPGKGIDVNTGKPAATSAGRFLGWNTIFGRDGDHATPYMTRIWIGRLRLHIFHRGDADPDCHDHPWDFWTFPLTPYVEEVVDLVVGQEPVRRRQVVSAWRWTFRPATHCHRVLGRYEGYAWCEEDDELAERVSVREVNRNPHLDPTHHPGKIITLVWRSKPKRSWGFLKNRDGAWCWVAWKEYVFGGGKRGPCE